LGKESGFDNKSQTPYNHHMLTKKDLENIKDLVEFSIVQSEHRTENRFDKLEGRFDKLENEVKDFKDEIHREISDIAETNREFLAKMDNHEQRIGKLEFKTGLAME